MPKTKFQEVIFTILMVFVMVYAMICYNIALNTGALTNAVFVSAFHELIIMAPIAFILDFFIVGKIAHKTALNFPAAFFWQLCCAGPFVRAIFRLLFNRLAAAPAQAPKA